MSFSIAKDFIDKLLTNDESIRNYIDTDNTLGIILEFIGGEPLLQVELIDQIIDYFMEQTIILHHHWYNKFRVSICSNGVLYFTPKVQEFLKKHQKHLSFSISIDGNKKLHDSCRVFPDGSGSYEIAMKATNHFREHYYKNIGSKMTLSPENIKYTSEALINLFKNGYNYIYANCVYEKGWTIADATTLYFELKKVADYLLNNHLEQEKGTSILNLDLTEQAYTDNKNFCGGAGSMLAIDYKGDFYPCLRYMESSIGNTRPPYIIGNVNEGIGQIEKTKEMVDNLNITYRSQSPDTCLDCLVSAGCGYCSALNYQEFGTVNKRTTYTCEMHKARVLANYYYQNTIARKENQKPYPFFVKEEDALAIIGPEEMIILKGLANG